MCIPTYSTASENAMHKQTLVTPLVIAVPVKVGWVCEQVGRKSYLLCQMPTGVCD